MIAVRDGFRALKEDGLTSFTVRTFRYFDAWDGPWNTITSRRPIGMNVFERDWDLLVVLDACRVDALRTVGRDVPWIEGVEQVRSVGSMSAEWTVNTFSERSRGAISETALLTGNVWTDQLLNGHRDHGKFNDAMQKGFPKWEPVTTEDFGHYEYVSAITNEDDKLHPECRGCPHVLTDRAISVGRNRDPDRMIVHYMMPHKPLVADALEYEPGETSPETLMDGPELLRELDPWEKEYAPAQRGDVSRERVYELYLKNLRLALDYVEILLTNVDAEKVVMTSDHGESFGEHGLWAHPFGFPLAPVKTVPWARSSATDEAVYEPRYEPPERRPTEREREEMLEHLGYLG
jgi:hypothetical protein